MTGNTLQSLHLDFKNLPLIEATVRVGLRAPVALNFQVIDRMRKTVRHSFPIISDPNRFELLGVPQGSIEFRPGSITGVAYTGHTAGLILTAQSQLVSVCWLRQVGMDVPDYPRYPVLRDALWHGVDAFQQAVAAEQCEIAVANLSYKNFLDVSDSAGVLRKYFSDQAQVKATRDAQEIQQVEFAWRGLDSVDLRFRLQKITAQRGDDTTEGYELTTAAGILLGNDADPKVGLDRLHDRLLAFFKSVISERAAKEWQLQRNHNV